MGQHALERFMMRCALLIAACGVLAVAAPPDRIRVLILTGASDLPYHDWRVSTPYLRGVLEGTGRFEVKVIEEVRGLTARGLSDYAALVLNYNGPRWGPEAEAAIEEFVRSGGGLVSFHGVTYGEFYGQEFQKRWSASSKGSQGWLAYPRLIGATWAPEKIGHSVRHAFPVKWIDREHPISRGLEETFLANDELYHKLDLLPDAKVLATAYSAPESRGTGRDEPIVWTTAFGAGRTLHLTLGHDLSAMAQPGFLAAFARGVEWASTGAVTLPAEVSARPRPRKDAARLLVVTGGHNYPAAFYTLFEGYDDIVWYHAASQQEAFTPTTLDRYDAVLLHDMGETIGDAGKASLRAFVEAGKGVVSTHHAIVDYTSWPWWYEEVTGGKYFIDATDKHGKSSYTEKVAMVAQPVKGMATHPVIRGLGPLPLVDEAYRGMWHSPAIEPLMEVDHPLNDKPVVYLGPHPAARVVYIQMGHEESTMRHPGYRKLVRNAVLWAAGKLQ
ncbi:MAG: ThuA domain-containing protein [Bryobacterales bacterium]|nr:ThuA domain-containing protein [Bryobacterales bacterium]